MLHNSLENKVALKIIYFFVLIHNDIYSSLLGKKVSAKQGLFYAITCVKKNDDTESICTYGLVQS